MDYSLDNNEMSEEVPINSTQVEANKMQENKELESELEPESTVGEKKIKTSLL